MAYSPIAFIAPNYSGYGTYWLKVFLPGTTTPKALSIDPAGSTTFAKLQLNVNGFFKSAGGALITPYVDGAYDAFLFETAAEADANNTAGATRIADNITAVAGGGGVAQTVVINNIQTNEQITLASAQSIVEFTTITAATANVFINGSGVDDARLNLLTDYTLRSDLNDRSIELLSTYPAGTTLTVYSLGSLSRSVSESITTAANKIEIIAHRGFLRSFPENTMLAFTSAIERGADSLECDVQITSDGTPVIFHDNTVDALTNGTGAISTLTLAAVQALTIDEVSGTAFSGARIPTFAELLKYCKGAGVKLYPEIKKYRTQSDIQLMVNAVIAAKMERQSFMSSFSISDVQYFRAINKDIMCGLLGSSTVEATYQTSINTLAELGNTSIVWNYTSLLTVPAIADYARLRGVDVQAYTVNDNTDAKELMRIGVYKIITDVKLEVI